MTTHLSRRQTPTPSPLALAMLAAAVGEIGVREKPLGSNRGPRVDEYQRATHLSPKDWGAWCASFVCWCMREALLKQEDKGHRFTFTRMATAAVRFIRRWSLAQDASTQTRDEPRRDILPGDILIYRFSHTGIAETAPDASGVVHAIEGNTNATGGREGMEVMRRPRNVNSIKCRIRLTV